MVKILFDDYDIIPTQAKYAGKQADRKEKEAAPSASAGQDKELASKLEKDVAEQGDKVRQLKTDKAEKAVIDVEVKKLIELKKQFSAALGQPEGAVGGKKGKKK